AILHSLARTHLTLFPLYKAPEASLEGQNMWADHVIDQHRFVSATERERNRYDRDAFERFPDADEIERLGGDSLVIAAALHSGLLNAAALGKAYKRGLDLSVFSLALKEGLCPAAFSYAVANGLNVRLFCQALEDGL